MKYFVLFRHFNRDGSHEDEIFRVHGFALREWRGKNTTFGKTLKIWPDLST